MKSQYLLLVCLAVFAAASASSLAADSNPCRKISIFDSYLNTRAHFDLSALIDHGPISINSTLNGIDWDLWTFGVCKALPTACPNTEPESVSKCGQPNVASMCQEYSNVGHDGKTSVGSFCVSSWNGTATFNIDGDGDRGIMVMLSEGDLREELRHRSNVILSIKCDHSIDTVNPGDLYVVPPFYGSSNYIVHMRHKAGCPTTFDPLSPSGTPGSTTPPVKGGLPGGILALICIGMLLIGLFGGGFVALWLNARYAWFADPRRQQTAQYSQFELDDDI